MENTLYIWLDRSFFVFHSLLILFILLGWIWRPLRKLHAGFILLTAFCWFGLGFWYGFGYCPCTHWHWMVREAMGKTGMPASYIKFLIDTITGWNINPMLVDGITLLAFVAACIASFIVNWRDWRLVGRGRTAAS